MRKYTKMITGFGLAFLMSLGVFAPMQGIGIATVYAADEPTIKVGLPNSVFNTKSELMERFNGYTITYNGTEYTTAGFFDAFSGSEFTLDYDSVYDDEEKAITVIFRSGNPLPRTEVSSNVSVTAPTTSAEQTEIDSVAIQVDELVVLGREGYASDVEYMMSEEYTEAVRQEFYRLINEHRKENGLRELEVNLELQDYADVRAAERRSIRGHVRPDGSPAGSGWNDFQNDTHGSYGENEASNRILKINPEEQAASYFNGWKNSEGHNRHMLLDFEPNIEMGFGMAVGLNNVGVATSPAIFASGF